MPTFSRKPKATQKTNSDRSATSSRVCSAHHGGVQSVLHLQRAYGNQAVKGMLQSHELPHIIQKTPGIGLIHHTLHNSPTIQRQAQASAPALPQRQPEVIQDSPDDQQRWRIRVDRAVRTFFRLRGARMTSSRVSFVDEPQFAQQLQEASIPDHLFDIFLNASFNSRPYHILAQSFAYPDRVSEMRLRTFIQEGMRQGYFEGQSREIEVRTGRRFPAFRVTPRQLIAENVAGVTDISGRRSTRRVLVQSPAYVDTLVHEACHFYIHSRFRDMAGSRPDRNNYLFGARIQKILEEGFAEYFSRQVMEDNRAIFGPLANNAYQAEVNNVIRLARSVGERQIRLAYFRGDERQIQRVGQSIDQYKEIERLIVG